MFIGLGGLVYCDLLNDGEDERLFGGVGKSGGYGE